VIFEAFKADQVDVRTGPGTKEWEIQFDFPAVQKGLVVKETFFTKDIQRMQGYVLNTRKPKFADARVRHAFLLAFDFEGQMKTKSFGNYNKRLQSYFQNSELQATGLPQGQELAILEEVRSQIPPEVFTSEFVNPVNGTPQNIRQNLRTALDLLIAAGWTLKGNKLVNAKGERMTVEFLLNDPGFEDDVLYYKSSLDRLGIEVIIRSVDPSQYENRVLDFDFDIVTDVVAQSLSPGNEQREYWGSEAADKRGSQNLIGIKNPAVDKLIDRVIFAKDRAELVAATKALDRVLLWNYYMISQFYRAEIWIPHWDRFGHPEKNPDYDSGFPTTWWWDEEKAKKVAAAK
jgi:microcin C transport system substrate-binding protein